MDAAESSLAKIERVKSGTRRGAVVSLMAGAVAGVWAMALTLCDSVCGGLLFDRGNRVVTNRWRLLRDCRRTQKWTESKWDSLQESIWPKELAVQISKSYFLEAGP